MRCSFEMLGQQCVESFGLLKIWGVPGIFDNLYARIAEMGNVGSQQLRREQRVFFATDEKCWAPDRGEIL
jgi:hypothetical protein